MTKTKEELQVTAFTMISYVGSAKSSYLEAVQAAREGDFAQAEALIEEGDAMRVKGHEQHFELVQAEAGGEDLPFSLILAHAEDQLMSSEVFLSLAQDAIFTNKRLAELEAKLSEK